MLRFKKGELIISLFYFLDIYIYTIKKNNMKPEYKEKALSYMDGINNRTKTIQEMLEGKRPSNQSDAIRLTKEIERLLEQARNIVELS
jgi:hypothetical protein